MSSQVDYDGNHHGDIESCDQTNASATVTLPLEEVLRLTTPEEDEFPSEREFQQSNSNPDTTTKHPPSNSSRPTSKSPKTGRKKTKRKSSGTSELKRAVKNEKKSVDKVVAAAIQNYEDSPTTLKKTKVTPRRTKSGSSGKKKMKPSSVASNSAGNAKPHVAVVQSNTDDTAAAAAAKKEFKKKTAVDVDPSWIVNLTATGDKSDDNLKPLHGVGSVASLLSIEKAGAIAVFPSDSEHHTRRRSVTNPGRISDIDMEALKDLEAQTPKGTPKEGIKRSILDSTTITLEEVPEPPQSQVIHAVATYSQQPPSVRRSETEGTYGSSSAKTAPTVSLDSTTDDGFLGSTALQDSESGTVTAKAISSENYYEEVRRQLQKEAVSAIAVVSLNDDGKPVDAQESKEFAKSKGKQDQDDREGIQKYAWLGLALALLVIVVVIVFVSYRRKLRNIEPQTPQESQNEGGFEICDGDMNCFMDKVMNSDLGLYWRQRITKILPRSTLEKLLFDSDYSSPHHKAFYFLIKNAESLYGVDNMVDMLNEELDPLEKSRVNVIFALVTIYEAMNGESWHVKTNWMKPDIDVCEWHGVHCGGELLPKENAVREDANAVAVDSFTVSGPAPGDLDDDRFLTDDGTFAVDGFVVEDDSTAHDATGERIFSIHNLELQANNLAGSIPDEILMLSNMVGLLDLSTNAITGTIPTQLAHLNRLRGFDIHNNQLESVLPYALSEMENLWLFDVSYNPTLGGRQIPFESWKNIEQLQIQGTKMTGTIPDEVCTMLETRNTGSNPFQLKYSEEFVFRASCQNIACPCCTECCKDDVCEPNVV